LSGEKGDEEVSIVSYVEIFEESFGTELEVFDLSGWWIAGLFGPLMWCGGLARPGRDGGMETPEEA
jgi:hypothetical protein